MQTSSFDAVLTCFNAEKTIGAAIHSILNQSIPLKRIIIIDDCSTDKSVDVILAYQAENPQIYLINNPINEGQSVCRNLGVSFSTSEFIVFFDDDDVSSPQRISAHKLMFERGSDINFVSSKIQYLGDYSRLCTNSEYLGSLEIGALTRLLLLGKSMEKGLVLQMPASTSAVSREAFQLVGGYDPVLRRLEDVDLALRFSGNSKIFGFSSDELVLRLATNSDDKGSGRDIFFESVILSRYRKFLSHKELKGALLHTETRRLYFSQKYFDLLIHLLSHPFYFLNKMTLSLAPARRMLHDFRKAITE